MNEQLLLTVTVGPVLSLVVVIAGYIVQNSNLNARMAEINSRMLEMKSDIRELLSAHSAALRAEMEKNQSELLGKFAELDRRVDRLEHRDRH
jgi:hypothetical protein